MSSCRNDGKLTEICVLHVETDVGVALISQTPLEATFLKQVRAAVADGYHAARARVSSFARDGDIGRSYPAVRPAEPLCAAALGSRVVATFPMQILSNLVHLENAEKNAYSRYQKHSYCRGRAL